MASDNSWYNAPPLSQIAASQQGGTRGAQVWGVTQDYTLITNFQVTPGGTWSGWSPMGSGPVQAGVLQAAAAQQNNGCVQLWVTDTQEQLWTIGQTSPGGDWDGWSGPNWNGAPKLQQLAACQQGGSRGAQFWAFDGKDRLSSCYQETPGGNWSGWITDWDHRIGIIDIAAAQQNDGRVQVWVLDQKMTLWSQWQTSPGGDWTPWAASWNNPPKLQSLAASQQGGSRGAQLWGIDENNAVWSCYQVTPGGNWSAWSGPGFAGSVPMVQLAAAQQNNGCVQLWGIDMNLSVKTMSQTAPGGDWNGWTP
jgi:hypothetical protein